MANIKIIRANASGIGLFILFEQEFVFLRQTAVKLMPGPVSVPFRNGSDLRRA